MKATTRIVLSLGYVLLLTIQTYGQPAKLDTARIEQLTGAKGTFDAKEGVFKVNLPRSDITAIVAGVRMSVPMGLGGWAAFKKVGSQCMVMGDNVMLEDQVNSVMSVALDNGLQVTALHNHFMWDTPRIMFMHIAGMGDDPQPHDVRATPGYVPALLGRRADDPTGRGNQSRLGHPDKVSLP